MLLKSDWRYYLMTVSMLSLLSLALVVSCAVDKRPGPAGDNATLPAGAAPATLLDIRSFQAQPRTIKAGEATTLTWNVSGASSLSIAPVTGIVEGNSGSLSISPRETTLYTLKASDGRLEITAKFLVIVKTADGSIIWHNSSSDNATPEQPYEGWSYYPNKYVEWKITDSVRHPDSSDDNCWHIGFITNNHPGWMMTDVTIQNKLILGGVLPGAQGSYTTSIDCKQLPELKWKWKIYR
jgi:hypothetical protein